MILVEILQYIILILCRKLRSIAGCFGLYFYWSITLTFVNVFSISLLSLHFLFLIFIPWAYSYFFTICAKTLRFQELLKIAPNYENSVAKNVGPNYAVPRPHRTVLCYTARYVTSKSDNSEDSEDEHYNAPDNKDENNMETEDSKIPCSETGECPKDKVSKKDHSSSPKSDRKRKSNPVHDLAKRQRPFDGLLSEHNLKEKKKLDFDIEDDVGDSKMDCTDKASDDLQETYFPDKYQSIKSDYNERTNVSEEFPPKLDDHSENKEQGDKSSENDSKIYGEFSERDSKHSAASSVSDCKEQCYSSSRGLNQKKVSSSNGKEQSDSSQNFWKVRKNLNLPEKFLKNYGDLSRSGLRCHVDPSESSQIEQDKLSSVYSTYHKDYSKNTIIAPDDILEPMNLKVQDNRLGQHGNKKEQSPTACPKKKYMQEHCDSLPWKLYQIHYPPKNAENPNTSSQHVGSRTRKNNMYSRPNELRNSSSKQLQETKDIPGFSSEYQPKIDPGYYVTSETSPAYQAMLQESLQVKTSDGSCVESANASATATSASPKEVAVNPESPSTSSDPRFAFVAYPGLADSPSKVKKDARYQKRYYKSGSTRSVVLSIAEVKKIQEGSSWCRDDFEKGISGKSPEKVKQEKNKSDSQKTNENSSNAPSLNNEIISPKSPSYCSSSENSSNGEEEQKECVPRNVLGLTLPTEVVNVPKKDEKNSEEPTDNVSQVPACSEDPKVSDLQPEIKDVSTPRSTDNEHGLSSSESLPPGCETPTSRSFPESPETFRSELSSTEERPFSDIKDEIKDDSTQSSSEMAEPKIPLFEYEKPMSPSSKSPENLSDFLCTEELQISDLQPECKDISTPCSPEVEPETTLFGYAMPISKKKSSESPRESVSKPTCTEQLQISDFPHEFKYDSPPCSPVIEQKNPFYGNEKPKSQNYSKSSNKSFSESLSIKEPLISNIQHEFKDDATQCPLEIDSEDSETSRSHEALKMLQAKALKKLLQRFLNQGSENFKNVDESQLLEMDTEEFSESRIDPMDANLRSKNGANSPGCSSSSSEESECESHLNRNLKTEETRSLESGVPMDEDLKSKNGANSPGCSLRMYQAKALKRLLQGFLNQGSESFKNVEESQLLEMGTEEFSEPRIDPMDANLRSKNGANSPGCSSSSSEENECESHLNQNLKTEETQSLESGMPMDEDLKSKNGASSPGCSSSSSEESECESHLNQNLKTEETQSLESGMPMDEDLKSKNGANSPGCSNSSEEGE